MLKALAYSSRLVEFPGESGEAARALVMDYRDTASRGIEASRRLV